MKKSILLLFPFLLSSCLEKEEAPVITIEKLIVNTVDEQKNYANRLDELPALKPGDEVDAYLSLDGNGSELKTFKLQACDELKTKLLYEKSAVTTEENLTDEEKGQLRFKDGVIKTSILVKAAIEQVEANGEVKLAFYLSSKAEGEGAQEVIDLKTQGN